MMHIIIDEHYLEEYCYRYHTFLPSIRLIYTRREKLHRNTSPKEIIKYHPKAPNLPIYHVGCAVSISGKQLLLLRKYSSNT